MKEPVRKRYVTLRFGNGWIVWDNDKARIVDGVYYDLSGLGMAISVTRVGNEDPNLLDRDWMTMQTDFNDSL